MQIDHLPRVSGIYFIRNTVTGTEYIGSSKGIRTRVQGHLWALRKGKHVNPRLQHSFVKHGEEAFTCGVLTLCARELLLAQEAHFVALVVDTYNLQGPERGRHSVSAESKARMSAAQRRRPPPSAETKARISQGQLGRKQPPVSEATRELHRQKRLGVPLSATTRERQREASPTKRPVVQISLFRAQETLWPSVLAAARALSCEHMGIRFACRHPGRIAAGSLWRYAEEVMC